jgi:hypothetical protein
MLALLTASSRGCQYFSPKTIIYRSNFKVFLTKMISEKSSTNYERRRHSLRILSNGDIVREYSNKDTTYATSSYLGTR